MIVLQTTNEVIDALGGTSKVARLLGRPMNDVSNWRSTGKFPPKTFLAIRALLAPGYTAPPPLWQMDELPADTGAES
jgi:hypothetical protein